MNPHKRYTYNPYRIIAYTTAFILLVALIPIFTHHGKQWTLKDFQTQTLKWETCYDSAECTSFKVPVDYNELKNNLTTTHTFTLQVLRVKATDQKHRIGSLIVNPGGPGGSATEYAYNADSIVSPAIAARYDIVGFDPRGVGQSEPIRCLTNKEEDIATSTDGSVENDAQFNKLITDSKSFANKCAKAAGSKLGHYSTLETAKDMEILRRLLGDAKLNYLGKSYGTYLGTLYAALYPNQIGHMVLDGAVDPQVPINQQNLTQAKGFDQALGDFLKKYPAISQNQITTLIAQAKTKPLTYNGRTLTDSLLITGMADALYDNVTGWPALKNAITKATQGDASPFFALADDYNQRDPNGRYIGNQSDISNLINCLDWPDTRSLTQVRADAASFNKVAPIFGPYIAYAGTACHFWKAKPVTTNLPTTFNTSAKILIVGVTKDPATPYIWAQGLNRVLANSSLLTFNGEGHTGLGRGDSALDKRVDEYLLVKSTP